MGLKERDEWGVMEATTMLRNREITRESWLADCFPPWGVYINYQIDNMKAQKGKTYLWWFGGPSWGIKIQDEIFLLDNYAGPSIVTRYENSGDCQNTGADYLHWMRLNAQVVDIWKFKQVDALFITHHHTDHCDIYTVKALLQTTKAKFIAPKISTMILKGWGVPDDRIILAKPGDKIRFKNTEVVVEKNFDLNALKTRIGLPEGTKIEPTMDDAAVTYIFNAEGGNTAFIGDGTYHNGFYGVGQRNKIDVAIMNMGHNPSGSYDKLSPYDAYRVGKALGAKVLIPDHYENWACTYIDPSEFEEIVKRNSPDIKTVILQTGAMFVYPDDQNIGRYKYPDWQERFDWRKARYTLENE